MMGFDFPTGAGFAMAAMVLLAGIGFVAWSRERVERTRREERSLRDSEMKRMDLLEKREMAYREQQRMSFARPGRFLGDPTSDEDWRRGHPEFVPSSSYVWLQQQWTEQRDWIREMEEEVIECRKQRDDALSMLEVQKGRADHQQEIIESLEGEARQLKAQLESLRGRKRTWGIFPRIHKKH